MAWGLRKRGAPAGEAKPRRVREGLRLSPNEERYVEAETLTGQVYAAPSVVRVRGSIDKDHAFAALQATCDNHEARRCGFERGADGVFTKYVLERAIVRPEFRSMPGASDEELIAAVNAFCLRKNGLHAGDLDRFILIETGHEEHVFGHALHHATSDAMTSTAFQFEWAGRILGHPAPEPLGQYSDFWDYDWRESDAYKAAAAFWTEKMRDVGELGVWPADRIDAAPSPVRPGETVTIPPDAHGRSQRAAEAIGVTHFSFFFAVYLVLLSRLTGSDAVCATFQSAGRRGLKDGAAGVQGVFSNSLPLATRVDPGESIAQLARRVRAEVKAAITHEIYPLHHLVRATGAKPRYAINWLPQSPLGPIRLQGLEFTPMPVTQNQDDDDLNLHIISRDGEGLLTVYYNPARFSADRVEAATRAFVGLVDAFAADVDRPIGELRSPGPPAAGRLPDLADPFPAGADRTIFAAFLEQARARPEAVALRRGDEAWSYGDLEERTRALASELRARGVRPGDRVAIVAERGPEFVVAMLAAARAGAVFVTLDAGYPEARLAQLAAIVRPSAFIRAGGERLADLAGRLAPERRLPILNAGAPPPPDLVPDDLDRARPSAPAYLLFTSGSTGRPKCVSASHAPLVAFLAWQAETYGLAADDGFTLLSGLSHDPVLRDVFGALSLGATLLVPTEETQADPHELVRWMDEACATVCHLTPQIGQVLAGAAGGRRLDRLRRVFWGGDRLHRTRVEAMAALAPRAKQVAFYGQTETPQAVAVHDIEPAPAWDFAPLGRGAAGAQLLVLDKAHRPLGIGELGEIAVRSRRLSLGLVEAGRLEPFADRTLDALGEPTVHLTGDLGLYLPDGQVMFAGRRDDQLKIHGHRVEPAELVAALLAKPGVRDAAVIPVGEGDDRTLVAVVTGAPPGKNREADLRAELSGRLPAYLIPSRIVWLPRIPLSPNGKPDRAALLAALKAAGAQADPPRDPVERALAAAWADIFGGMAIDRQSTLGSLGGDSLTYVNAYLAAEKVLGEVPAGWQDMTVAQLAAATRRAPSFLAPVDTAITLRALAILLVVLGHFGTLDYGGGATGVLMLVSGFMAAMPLQEAFARREASPLLRAFRNLFVPTALMVAAIFTYRLIDGRFDPSVLLFAADLRDYSGSQHHRDVYMWYVDCLLHMLLMLYLAVLGVKALGFRLSKSRFLVGLFVLGCAGRFLLPAALDPGFFAADGQAKSTIYFLPTSNLATLVLGALIAGVDGSRAKSVLGGVLVVYAGLTAALYGPVHATYLLGAGGMMLYLPRLRLPRAASLAIPALAGASLWIYLSHLLVREALYQSGVAEPGLPGVALALAGGVAAWRLWTWTLERLGSVFNRPLTPQDATV